MTITYIINSIDPNLFPDFDPLNPPRAGSEWRFSHDPVHPDALEIIEKLRPVQREGEVRKIVWEYFGKYFGEEIIGDNWDSYKDSILDLWKWYGR